MPSDSGRPPGAGSGCGRMADRPTRLLVVTPIYPTPDRPEAGAFVQRRVEALRARGVEVEVLAFPDYRRPGWRRYLGLLLGAVRARPRPDGVEGHVLLWAGLVALLAARLHRRPLLIYAHGLDVRETARRSPVHRLLGRMVARGADEVITNSAATARLVAALGVEAVVIPPGVDTDRFRPGDQSERRARVGLPPDGLVALYVGTLSRRKGADVFAAAVAASPEWLGVMVGAGELEGEIRSGWPAIRLAGAAAPDAVPDWIVAADIVVVPSREEPLGLAAVEALACGVPVVASATGGLVEVVTDGVTGILVPPGEDRAVAAALARLRDPELRSRLGDAARASVAGHELTATTTAMAALWRRHGVTA